MKHTPLPWWIDEDVYGCKNIWGPPHPEFPDAPQEIACTPGMANEEEDLANARYIVTAANHFEEVVKALEEVIKKSMSIGGYIGKDGQYIKKLNTLLATIKKELEATP